MSKVNIGGVLTECINVCDWNLRFVHEKNIELYVGSEDRGFYLFVTQARRPIEQLSRYTNESIARKFHVCNNWGSLYGSKSGYLGFKLTSLREKSFGWGTRSIKRHKYLFNSFFERHFFCRLAIHLVTGREQGQFEVCILGKLRTGLVFGIDEIFNLRHRELANTNYTSTWADFIAERWADLCSTKRQLSLVELEKSLEVDKNALSCLWP